jgi:hypothetical protein
MRDGEVYVEGVEWKGRNNNLRAWGLCSSSFMIFCFRSSAS